MRDALLRLAVIGVALASGQARACDSFSSVADTTCVQMAPISGDVVADACPVAGADIDRIDAAIRDAKLPPQPGAPIWPRGYLSRLRNEAVARQAKVCAP